jgi:hypothetical protein
VPKTKQRSLKKAAMNSPMVESRPMRSIAGMIEVLIAGRTILMGCGKVLAEILAYASIVKPTALNSQRKPFESKSAPR